MGELTLESGEGRFLHAVLAAAPDPEAEPRLTLLPWKRLEWEEDRRLLITDVAPGHLASAPPFPSDRTPELASQQWQDEIRQDGPGEEDTGVAGYGTPEEATEISESPTGHPAVGGAPLVEPTEPPEEEEPPS